MKIKIDKIIRSKRKTISLTVTRAAELVVRCPEKTSIDYIEDLIERRSGWISEKMKAASEYSSLHVKPVFSDGGRILYLGHYLALELSDAAKKISVDGDRLTFPVKYLSSPEDRLKMWYHSEAKRIISERTAALAAEYHFKYTGIKISGARTRWGSCSYKNGLSFTRRLVMAPVETVDYVIIHELCHTVIKNHSKTFWAKVKSILPDYKIRRGWLKDNRALLDL